MTPEQQLVDRLIDRGLELSPATDWTLMVLDEVALLIPRDSDTLERPRDGRPGYFRAHVYRDREVVSFPMAAPLAVLSDSAGQVDPLYLNLTTGAVGTSRDGVGLPGA